MRSVRREIQEPGTIARRVLQERVRRSREDVGRVRGTSRTVVMDVPVIDELRFRGKLRVLVGDPRPVGADDLVVAMPARIAINKAIELAIQFVSALGQQRAALEQAPDGLGFHR